MYLLTLRRIPALVLLLTLCSMASAGLAPAAPEIDGSMLIQVLALGAGLAVLLRKRK